MVAVRGTVSSRRRVRQHRVHAHEVLLITAFKHTPGTLPVLRVPEINPEHVFKAKKVVRNAFPHIQGRITFLERH